MSSPFSLDSFLLDEFDSMLKSRCVLVSAEQQHEQEEKKIRLGTMTTDAQMLQAYLLDGLNQKCSVRCGLVPDHAFVSSSDVKNDKEATFAQELRVSLLDARTQMVPSFRPKMVAARNRTREQERHARRDRHAPRPPSPCATTSSTTPSSTTTTTTSSSSWGGDVAVENKVEIPCYLRDDPNDRFKRRPWMGNSQDRSGKKLMLMMKIAQREMNDWCLMHGGVRLEDAPFYAQMPKQNRQMEARLQKEPNGPKPELCLYRYRRAVVMYWDRVRSAYVDEK